MNDVPGMRQKQVPTNREKSRRRSNGTGADYAGTVSDTPNDQTIGAQSDQRPSVVRGPAGSGSKETGRTQRGQSPEGQTRPSEVGAQRARQDPAWSKAQCGQSPKRPDRPSEVRALVQASVVPGIMACRDELGFHGRSIFRAPRVATSN